MDEPTATLGSGFRAPAVEAFCLELHISIPSHQSRVEVMPNESSNSHGRKHDAPALGAGIGVALGAGVGAAIGVALTNIAVGVAVGAGVGVALGAAIGLTRR